MAEISDDVKRIANDLAVETDCDIFLYNSSINRPYDDEIISSCCKRDRRSNLLLLLTTEGGDADAAFRITRCFQEHYESLICMVPGYCKSAGSLILTGSHELVMGDAGEIGPLDVQMLKKDEPGERESGLLVLSAFTALRQNTYTTFEHFFTTLKKRNRLSVTFRTAAEYAAKLTNGLFAPIYEQIDPMRVAESTRSQAIGLQYGIRLAVRGGMNISPDGLDRLISAYPTHGFVIDRAEAAGIFSRVRKPNASEERLIEALGRLVIEPLDDPEEVREYISDMREREHDSSDAPAQTS